MPTIERIKKLDPSQLKEASAALAKQLAINIALGIVATVVVTLASGAIVGAIKKPTEAE